MQNKQDRLLTCVRLMLYLFAVIVAVLCLNEKIYLKCTFIDKFGIECPACGSTRATLAILRGNIISAIEYNAFYSLVIFPLAVFLVLEDVYTVVKRSIFKKSKVSLIEVMFGGKL